MLDFLIKFLFKFTQPSSWAGIAAILASLLHIPTDSALLVNLELIGAGLAGILAFVLNEKVKKKDISNG